MNILKNPCFLAAALTLLAATRISAQPQKEKLQHIVDTTFAAHSAAIGIMASVVWADNKAWNYAAGVSDKKTNNRLNPAQPVVTASNTKTYVAATILRLQEQKQLDVYDAIEQHLPANTVSKLKADGYNTQAIKLAHLLSHTSGISDYVNDEYFAFINANKQYKWTRDEQIDRAMKVGDPLAAPGDTFKYADVNYLLLTEIIEQKTGKPFYESIRELLNYKGLKLNSTWFIGLEPAPAKILPFVHQYWLKSNADAQDFDPSWDLYGGGGIVAPPADMAQFFKYLFEGKIIKDTQVLAKIYTPVAGAVKTNYSLGLRTLNIGGHTGYYHGGFWGTDIIYFPDFKTAISIVILEREYRDLSAAICKAMVEVLEKEAIKK